MQTNERNNPIAKDRNATTVSNCDDYNIYWVAGSDAESRHKPS